MAITYDIIFIIYISCSKQRNYNCIGLEYTWTVDLWDRLPSKVIALVGFSFHLLEDSHLWVSPNKHINYNVRNEILEIKIVFNFIIQKSLANKKHYTTDINQIQSLQSQYISTHREQSLRLCRALHLAFTVSISNILLCTYPPPKPKDP